MPAWGLIGGYLQPMSDPKATGKSGDSRYNYQTPPVTRGGSWFNNRYYEPVWVRAVSRVDFMPASRDDITGFRCARLGSERTVAHQEKTNL